MSPLRVIGLVIGASICLAALLAWRLPPSSHTLGADVRLIATPPGELQVKPGGAIVAAHGLKPGSDAQGSFEVRNLAGRALIVQLRGLPSSPTLNRDLRLRFRAGGHTVAAGPVGKLRSFAGRGLRLAARAAAKVEATLALSRGNERFKGQILDITLEFAARPAGGGK